MSIAHKSNGRWSPPDSFYDGEMPEEGLFSFDGLDTTTPGLLAVGRVAWLVDYGTSEDGVEEAHWLCPVAKLVAEDGTVVRDATLEDLVLPDPVALANEAWANA